MVLLKWASESMRRIFYGWWVVGGAFILLFCAGGTHFYAFPVFFDAMIRDMEWSRSQTAAALSIGIFVVGAAGPVIGMLVRKTGVKAVMIFGSIVAGVGFVLLSTVSALWQFYIFYGVILSIGIACIQSIPNITAVQSWFVQNRSTALGIATAGIGAGGAVMAPLVGWLISMYSWQVAFLFLAAIVTLVGIPISAVVMRTFEERKAAPVENHGKVTDSDRVPVKGATLGQAVKGRAFWLVSIGAMLWAWACSAGLIHQVAFAVDMGIERVAAASTVGLLTAISIPGRLGFGRLGDMVDKRYVFMMGTSLQIVAFIVLMRTTNLSMLYIYSLLLGINIGGAAPILPGLIADYFGTKYFAVIYGVCFFIVTLGIVIGPIYGGWIFDTTGSYSVAFLTSIVLSFMAIIVVYLAGKPHRSYRSPA